MPTMDFIPAKIRLNAQSKIMASHNPEGQEGSGNPGGWARTEVKASKTKRENLGSRSRARGKQYNSRSFENMSSYKFLGVNSRHLEF